MNPTPSKQSSFFDSTFSGDPSHLQVIKQAAVRFDFSGSWKSCTYSYLDINPNIARLFQERHFDSCGENWMGELEAALKQNPKLIKAAYVTTSDLTTKVGLEILSKIKVALPPSQDPVVSYLGHWISHAFGKNAPPGEYRGKVLDSLQEPLMLSKDGPTALIDYYALAVGRVNPERCYGIDDISDYLELIVEKELNGYRAKEQGKCRFILQGNEQGFFKENEEEWVVALTPPIDSAALSLPLGYFLDRELWPQDSRFACYQKIKPHLKELEEGDPKLRYECLYDLLSHEYGEGVVENLLTILEDIEYEEEALEVNIMDLEIRKNEDLFEELAPVLQQKRARVKILIPYNRIQDHWLTGEIQISKELRFYRVQIWAHDPYGEGEMEEESFKQLLSTLAKRIRAIQSEAEIKFFREKSPYNRRQAAADHTSCGVIVIEDILRRISGASLTRESPYSIGVIKLREAHMEKMKRYLTPGHRTRENFLKRNTLSTEPASFLVRETPYFLTPSQILNEEKSFLISVQKEPLTEPIFSLIEKAPFLTPPQILNEEKSSLIGVREDPLKEKVFKYVKKAEIPGFSETLELDQPLQQAISYNQASLRYQSGIVTTTARSTIEVFKVLLSVRFMPDNRGVPNGLLSRIIHLTFCQPNVTPDEEFLSEMRYEVMVRAQNFVKMKTLNLHQKIDEAELESREKRLGFFKKISQIKQNKMILEKRLSVLWKKLSNHAERPILSRKEIAFVEQALDLRQRKDLYELEKRYVKSLSQANLEYNYSEELACVMNLGDLYLKKQEAPFLLQSASFYNYALCLLQNPKYLTEMASAEKERVKEKTLHCLGRLEIQLLRLNEIPVGSVHEELERAQHSFKENRRILAEKRRDIDESLAKLGEDPSPKEIIGLQKEITKHMKSFTAQLIDQCIKMLGKPPCEYAVIGLGSMAREEMTHYSDLEFAILIEEGAEQHKEYFRNLTYFVHLKVINLGETILPGLNISCLKGRSFFDAVTPRGFAFDGAGMKGKGYKTPLGNGTTFELIQTPTKLAQYVGGDREGVDWPTREPHLPMKLLNFVLITGEDSLCSSYRKALDEELNRPYRKGFNLRNYLARMYLVAEDEQQFNPILGNLEKEWELFKVKQDLYRFPHLSIARLALLSNLQVPSTFDRIKELQRIGVLNRTTSERLQWLICEVTFQRLKIYSHYKAQQELMNPLIKAFVLEDPQLVQKQFTRDPDTLKKLTKIYQILIPFYKALQAYLDGNFLTLQKEILWDESDFTLGQIAARLLQYEQAQDYYLEVQDFWLEDKIKRLSALGVVELQLGKSQDALFRFQESLPIFEMIYGKEHPNVATCLNNIGMAYHSLGDAEHAFLFYKQALTIRENTYGKEHSDVATSLNNIGDAFYSLSRAIETLVYYEKALVIRKKLYGEEHPDTAKSLSNLGNAHHSLLGNAQKALSYYQEALTIQEKIYGNEHPDVARSLNNIGSTYHSLGNAEKALAYYQRALSIQKKIYGEEHPDVASSLSNIGTLYSSLRQVSKALSFHQKALIIREKIYGKEHPAIATSLNNIGSAYYSVGKAKEALPYLQKALAIQEKIHGNEHPDIIESRKNVIAATYQAIEHPQQKIVFILAAYAKLESQEEKEHASFKQFYEEGDAMIALGKYQESIEYYEKALATQKKMLKSDDPGLARSLNKIGLVYQKINRIGFSLQYHHQALEIFRKHSMNLELVDTLNYLGTCYEKLENPVMALKNFDEALSLSSELSQDVPVTAEQKEKVEKAITYYQQALAADLSMYGRLNPSHPSIIKDLLLIGRAYQKIGAKQQALKYYEQGKKLISYQTQRASV